jgi:hypothetical protein
VSNAGGPKQWRRDAATGHILPMAYNTVIASVKAGITPQEMRKLINAGEIEAFGLGAKIKRYVSVDELERLIRRDPQRVLERLRDKERRKKVEDAPAKCGVYLLLSEGVIVYIGRSLNMRSRVKTHRVDGRPFDEVRAIPCDEAASVWLERDLIRVLRPTQNRTRYQRHAKAAEHKLRDLLSP